MQSVSIVVFQSDPRIAQALASSLGGHFHSVCVASTVEELEASIAKHRAEVVIVDVELSTLSEITKLHREFPRISIVCTHRLADEEMWAAALSAGAEDILPPSDTAGILHSALRSASALSNSAAA
jgi:DNA-binding NarL/FixJ family response regulator